MYTGYEIADNYKRTALIKTTAKWYRTLILAIFAGAFIAFAAALATIAGTASDGTKSTLIKAAVFPIGLILVVLTGSELFTGNCLLIAPLLSRDVKLASTLKNLSIVYAGNLVGSVVVALLTVYSGTFDGIPNAIVSAAAYKCGLGFGTAMLRAIPCNVLVCFAVWCSFAGKSTAGKIISVYPPIFAFVALGMEHSVANMYYLTAGLLSSAKYGIAAQGLNAGNALLNSLLPATLGNIIGGTVLTALPLWLAFFRKSTPNKKAESTAADGK